MTLKIGEISKFVQTMKNNKLGHQAPKGSRQTRFNCITMQNLHYCESHNFVYDPEIEEEKLYNGEPCIYTDERYKLSYGNSYRQFRIGKRGKRFETFSLKSAIRKIDNIRNIPIGSIINLETSWYYSKKNCDTSYLYKVKYSKKFEPNYEINKPSYQSRFTGEDWTHDPVWENELADTLRQNGFIVSVNDNTAVAYGHGKKIGFSLGDNDFWGYWLGKENILWDRFGEFDKWSRCKTIPKNIPAKNIIEKLMAG